MRQQRVLPDVRSRKELFRTDARADNEEVWIGGWALDSSDLAQCRWFSEKLNRKNAWWAFLAGEPFGSIASLEMLATLAALVVFDCRGCKQHELFSIDRQSGKCLRAPTLVDHAVPIVLCSYGDCSHITTEKFGPQPGMGTASTKHRGRRADKCRLQRLQPCVAETLCLR